MLMPYFLKNKNMHLRILKGNSPRLNNNDIIFRKKKQKNEKTIKRYELLSFSHKIHNSLKVF